MSFILGVDFSGASLAGEKIWVSRASITSSNLEFDFLARAADLPAGAAERESALTALNLWIQEQENPACGFDFPFSLSRDVITEPDYASWLGQFKSRFPTPEALKESTEDKRRECDVTAKAPFSPLNLRLFRQTYYGIRDVLIPLKDAGAQILPFDAPEENRMWLLEVCPASLLKREKLYLSYKGRSISQRQNRETIADELATRTPFTWSDELREQALQDSEGDALDAILAAVCVFRALKSPDQLAALREIERFEGKIYY